jgi:predicted O-methyltransferase YrrM
MQTPGPVLRALERAEAIGFSLSSELVAGRLLATLAASVPADGRILEIGTGVGAGLAWIWTGLGSRSDVSVISVEIDEQRFQEAAREKWPGYFRLIRGSIFELYSTLGQFDLIFADSGAGKWDGRDSTLAAVKPGGILLMDDMTPPKWHFDKHEQLNAEVRISLSTHPEFVCAELAVATGILVATRRRNEGA